MNRILILLILGLFLTGCYSSSLTMVGPATGVASGKIGESAVSSSLNYAVKKQTGKSATEHILSESQNKTVEKQKAKVNPCNLQKNNKLCSVLNTRIEKTRKQLMGLNLQARIEQQHKKIFSKSKK